MFKTDVHQNAGRLKHFRKLARIISAPIIGFTLVVFIAHIVFPDTEPGSYPPIENLLPVLMGMSVLGLGLAWRWEFVGGAMAIGFFILHLAVFWIIRGRFFPLPVLLIFSPVVIDGALFVWTSWKNKK